MDAPKQIQTATSLAPASRPMSAQGDHTRATNRHPTPPATGRATGAC